MTIGLRLAESDEKLGADFVEHAIGDENPFPSYERGLLSTPHSLNSVDRSQSLPSMTESSNENMTLVNRQRPKCVRFDRVAPATSIPGEVQNGFASPVHGSIS